MPTVSKAPGAETWGIQKERVLLGLRELGSPGDKDQIGMK